MWEAYCVENEDVLWTCLAFAGGIAGEQSGPCGAVSAGAMSACLRHRTPLSDKQASRTARLQAREDAVELVGAFKGRFGAIACDKLLGIDFSQPGAYQAFRESDVWKDKCNKYVEFVIERLYELDEKRLAAPES